MERNSAWICGTFFCDGHFCLDWCEKANVMLELLHAYVVMLTIIADIAAVSVGVLG
jgi:hypothetical protein